MNTTYIHFSLDDVDILPEEMDPKFQGTESFETTMGSLGLTERHPIPDPVNFAEPDPLGSHTQGLHSDTDNVLAALSESHINPWTPIYNQLLKVKYAFNCWNTDLC